MFVNVSKTYWGHLNFWTQNEVVLIPSIVVNKDGIGAWFLCFGVVWYWKREIADISKYYAE